MALNRQELLRLARYGAETRIAELEAEIARIRATFKTGGRRGRGDTRAIGTWPVPEKPVGTLGKRRKMSAAGRKRIQEALKKRWAKWRAEKGKE